MLELLYQNNKMANGKMNVPHLYHAGKIIQIISPKLNVPAFYLCPAVIFPHWLNFAGEIPQSDWATSKME